MIDSPNKKELYGVFQGREDWKDRLYRKGAYKALDVMDDDMQITANKTGLTTGGMALLAASILGAGALGFFANRTQPTPEPQATPPAATQEYEVTFWSDDGAPISVESK